MKMTVSTTKWDLADHLETDERAALFIEAAFEDGDPAVITAALGDVARARGMTQLSRETGLAREALYRALSRDGHPEFETVLKVIKALGLRLTTVPLDHEG